jgi:hypothetical protein
MIGNQATKASQRSNRRNRLASPNLSMLRGGGEIRKTAEALLNTVVISVPGEQWAEAEWPQLLLAIVERLCSTRSHVVPSWARHSPSIAVTRRGAWSVLRHDD